MPNASPVSSLPTQRVLARLAELEAELKCTSDEHAKRLDDELVRFQSEVEIQLRGLGRPPYFIAIPELSLRSVKELLPIVVSTAVLTATATTLVALLMQR